MKYTKHFYLLLLVLCLFTKSFSQVTLYTSTLNMAGGGGSVTHPDIGTLYVDWSVGENTIVNTFVNNANLITTNGMLQPARDFKSTIDLSDIIVNFYPNPITSPDNQGYLNLTLTNQLGRIDAQVYNTLGQLVIPGVLSINSSGIYRLDFSRLPAGMYILWLRYTAPNSPDVRQQTYKVVKLH